MFRVCRKVVLHRLFHYLIKQFWQIMLAYVLTFEINNINTNLHARSFIELLC